MGENQPQPEEQSTTDQVLDNIEGGLNVVDDISTRAIGTNVPQLKTPGVLGRFLAGAGKGALRVVRGITEFFGSVKGKKPVKPKVSPGEIREAPLNSQYKPDDVKKLPDDTLVCRGGKCTADRFKHGTGVALDEQGKLQGASVSSAQGKTLEELTQNIPHNTVGVTTAGDVRKAGGDVIPSPTSRNPDHATLRGITPEQAEKLMTPAVPNPNAK